LNAFFEALSRLGYGGTIWILIAVGLALATRRPFVALLTAATVWTADLTALAIKVPVDRPRPFITEPQPPPLFIGVRGDSFPSAHSATSFAAAVVLTSLFPRRWPVFFGLAVAIAFSRVYVGVHYPGDVLAGAALGVLIAIALPRLVTTLRPPRPAPPPG
jgi:undecaprenyl-diphosphatase